MNISSWGFVNPFGISSLHCSLCSDRLFTNFKEIGNGVLLLKGWRGGIEIY